ncbi:hypothetical protein BN2476_170038 [Paraburkholderia piptadeniae]|uniref:Uncharacterized protein n=1 Tax=Paraburkholderia piptadeniae TaxID=1701573 RepID=A0A1N7RSZ6_9BURK|nr:hypothetical protein BN2476_170038 [Paraburkholderia piptadeniae]
MVSIRESFSLFGVRFGRSGRAPALGRKVILGRIDGNPVQPRIERGLAAELGQRPICLDKGILGHVLDLGGIPHEARDQPDDLAVVLRDQKLERGLVAVLDAFNQHLIYFFFAHLINPLTFACVAGHHCSFPFRMASYTRYSGYSLYSQGAGPSDCLSDVRAAPREHGKLTENVGLEHVGCDQKPM